MGSTLSNVLCHLVFSTKRRLPLITTDVQQSLYPLIGTIIRDEKGTLLSIGGTEDHMHILCKIHPAVSISNMTKKIKGASSKHITRHGLNGGAFEWQRGYAAFSVSQSMVPKVDTYIQNQVEHHRSSSFRDELVELLTKHGMEFDEQYVFDS